MKALTPYDTGQRAQPHIWPIDKANVDTYGKVDFDNDESATVATIYVEAGEHGYVVHVDGDASVIDGDLNLVGVVGLLRSLASCMKDGEDDGEGEEFIMENDDAVDTLHSFISDARGLLGLPDFNAPPEG